MALSGLSSCAGLVLVPKREPRLKQVGFVGLSRDKALAVAIDYVRAIKKTPIVVNDTRGFFVNRCVLRYMSEAYNMLVEGVPAAMIENAARMAGMPVGPLSLNDEVAVGMFERSVAAIGSKAIADTPQSPGGEDFSWYLEHVPGAMARLGVWAGFGPQVDLHAPNFDLDERALAIGVRALAGIVLNATSAAG